MNDSQSIEQTRRFTPPVQRLRAKDFVRDLGYQIGGLPVAVRGAFTRDQSSEAVIRRAYAKRYWHPQSALEFVRLALALITWPIAVIALEIIFLAKNGATAARQSGRPLIRQLFDQMKFYLCTGVLPPWYYIFELHRGPPSGQARDFIYRWESKGGVMRLLKEGARAPRSELSNKAIFAEQCAASGIRSPELLAVIDRGRTERLVEAGDFARDLFVKPVFGRGGKGAQRWDFVAGGYRSPSGITLTPEALFERLENHSHKAPLIIQPRLVNHPALDPLNNGALSTIRMLTCLDEHNQPELAGAAMRMAIGGNHVVDNLHSGGIAAAVDLDSGCLGQASNLGAEHDIGWIDRHPDSGARITGFKIPHWSEACSFAISTHRQFSDRVLVGWDVAITPDGPVLVEGNGAPDLDIMQRFARQGLMAARFGVLLAYHLSQLDLASVPLV